MSYLNFLSVSEWLPRTYDTRTNAFHLFREKKCGKHGSLRVTAVTHRNSICSLASHPCLSNLAWSEASIFPRNKAKIVTYLQNGIFPLSKMKWLGEFSRVNDVTNSSKAKFAINW